VVNRVISNINIKLKTIAPDKIIKFEVADFLNYNKDVSTIVEELFNKVSI
jgi:hypothetical protein